MVIGANTVPMLLLLLLDEYTVNGGAGGRLPPPGQCYLVNTLPMHGLVGRVVIGRGHLRCTNTATRALILDEYLGNGIGVGPIPLNRAFILDEYLGNIRGTVIG